MNSQTARKRNPSFDWEGYDAARQKINARTISLLGADRNNRRLGAKTQEPKYEEPTMSELAVFNQGNALAKTAWESQEEVKQIVMAAYGNGNSKLTPPQIAAVCAIAWTMQLDPSPGVGHLYAYEQGGKLVITIGYQGYLHKAEQQHQIYYDPARQMNADEMTLHGIKPGEIGMVVELYDMKRARMAKELNLPIKPIVGIAVWRPGDNVPKNRTAAWVAGKNAVKDAIRQLGLGFGSVQIPQVDGFYYDRESDSFVQDAPMVSATAPTPVQDDVIEGEIAAAMQAKREVVETQAVVVDPVAPAATEETKPALPAFDPWLGHFVQYWAGTDEINITKSGWHHAEIIQVNWNEDNTAFYQVRFNIGTLDAPHWTVDTTKIDRLRPLPSEEGQAVEAAKAEQAPSAPETPQNGSKTPSSVSGGHSSDRPYAPETLIARLQAITEKYSAEDGGNMPITGNDPQSALPHDPNAAKAFARELMDFFIESGLGQRTEARRKRFMKQVWDIESSYDATVAMRSAFRKWRADTELAKQELRAYVAWVETAVDEKKAA